MLLFASKKMTDRNLVIIITGKADDRMVICSNM